MATSGELRAIIEELELVDVGDAADYLGEDMVEGMLEEETLSEDLLLLGEALNHTVDCDCLLCQVQYPRF